MHMNYPLTRFAPKKRNKFENLCRMMLGASLFFFRFFFIGVYRIHKRFAISHHPHKMLVYICTAHDWTRADLYNVQISRIHSILLCHCFAFDALPQRNTHFVDFEYLEQRQSETFSQSTQCGKMCTLSIFISFSVCLQFVWMQNGKEALPNDTEKIKSEFMFNMKIR